LSEIEPVQVVLEFYEALRESRINDMLGLVDPEVVCRPLVRPGLSLYSGYDGMIRLDSDIHALHGRYQMEIGQVTEQAGSQVTVQATIHPEPGRGQPPLPVTSIYLVRDGLITSIESLDSTSAG
jgi:SnoaL-like protein